MTSRWHILVSAPYMIPVIDRFRPQFEARGAKVMVPAVLERLEEQDLVEVISEIDGVICGDDRFTARVLDAAKRLKVISKWGTGIDSIDQEACKKRGIAVRNTPNAFSDPVGDSVLGYMLCFARRLPWMTEDMRNGGWSKLPSISLGEATLGVIGVGDVGRAVVRRALGFGIRILGTDPRRPPDDFIAATGIQMVSKEELLRESDFVSLNCDLNPTTFHLISDAEFELVKRTAVIINTARGPIIDEAALVTSLKLGRLAGAALDVFEDEPLPKDSPLRSMPNVMMAAHNANSSPRAWERVHQNTIANMFDVLEKNS